MIKDFIKKNRMLAAKKACAVVLLLFGMVFVLSNRDIYYSAHIDSVPVSAEAQEDETLIEFSGSRTFELKCYTKVVTGVANKI